MTAQVLRFPAGRSPLGYEQLVEQLDLAVAEGRAPAGAIYLLFGTPGSKHYKGPKLQRGRVQGPPLTALREQLARCRTAPPPPPEKTP